MKLVINAADGCVQIDGENRKVNLNRMHKDIEVIRWDSDLQQGEIQYKDSATKQELVRDIDEEKKEYETSIRHNKRIDKLEPKYKPVKVRRGIEMITDISPYQWAVDAFYLA